MRAIILAAGVGSRLFGDDGNQPSKCLLKFDGKTLMQRHVESLQAFGVKSMTLVVGYRHEEILADIETYSPDDYIQTVYNPRFRNGPVISLWEARETLLSGDPVLFMDADVLYPPEMLSQLIKSPHETCFLFDEDFEDTDEPVRLCLRNGIPVEFGKNIKGTFDRVGEWPGFLKLSPVMAAKLAGHLQDYINQELLDEPYEPAMRDTILNDPPEPFGIEDITGTPWIEIDFPEDLKRAANVILPDIKKSGS